MAHRAMIRSLPHAVAVVLLFSSIASGPAGAQTVPPPLTPPDRPLPGQSPNPSVIIIAPPITVPAAIDVSPGGFGARSPLGDTSPSARPAGLGGQALGDTSPASVGARALPPSGALPGPL